MADTKTSALTAATAALGADEIPVNEAGTSKKLTVALIRDYMFANLGQYDPGSFTVATGFWLQQVSQLIVSGSHQVVIAGTGRIYIDG